eukprot:6213941-Pleurochrysis_carterae.AAC.3
MPKDVLPDKCRLWKPILRIRQNASSGFADIPYRTKVQNLTRPPHTIAEARSISVISHRISLWLLSCLLHAGRPLPPSPPTAPNTSFASTLCDARALSVRSARTAFQSNDQPGQRSQSLASQSPSSSAHFMEPTCSQDTEMLLWARIERLICLASP